MVALTLDAWFIRTGHQSYSRLKADVSQADCVRAACRPTASELFLVKQLDELGRNLGIAFLGRILSNLGPDGGLELTAK